MTELVMVTKCSRRILTTFVGKIQLIVGLSDVDQDWLKKKEEDFVMNPDFISLFYVDQLT